jgi:hypothetical protein
MLLKTVMVWSSVKRNGKGSLLNGAIGVPTSGDMNYGANKVQKSARRV